MKGAFTLAKLRSVIHWVKSEVPVPPGCERRRPRTKPHVPQPLCFPRTFKRDDHLLPGLVQGHVALGARAWEAQLLHHLRTHHRRHLGRNPSALRRQQGPTWSVLPEAWQGPQFQAWIAADGQ